MKDDIKLPPEFISTNDIPVSVATIKRGRMEEILREAVEAVRQQRRGPSVPEGWKLVPVELTHIMMFLGVAEWLTRDDPEEDVQGIWEAMIEAAPKFGEEQ